MIFSSIEFIFVFLILFLATYFIVPNRFKNNILLIGSIIFYIVGYRENPEYIALYMALIATSVVINCILGQLIEINRKIIIFGLLYNIGYLYFFKYYDFTILTINNFKNTSFETLNLIFQIGVSFYTFEFLSYLLDVYYGKCRAEESIVGMARYIFMFPQLISGPLVRYEDIKKQLDEREISVSKFALGCRYFILGLGFKILLADRIAFLWNDILRIGFDAISTKLAWLGAIGYSLQIYFDFCGYSLMAIGLGKMLGFELPENFNAPYLAHSMTEFFRRWHISLGNWFKNYVYIPLGGNRGSMIRTIFNLFIVWCLTAVWHGGHLNFLMWGLLVFLIIVIEKVFFKKLLEKVKILGHLYMVFLIPIMWTIFAITDIEQLKIMIGKLFGIGDAINVLDYIDYIQTYGILIIAGIICCTKLPEKLLLEKGNNIFCMILLLIVFWCSIYYMYIGADNAFLYFSF